MPLFPVAPRSERCMAVSNCPAQHRPNTDCMCRLHENHHGKHQCHHGFKW